MRDRSETLIERRRAVTRHRTRASIALFVALPVLLAACAADRDAAPTPPGTGAQSVSPRATDSVVPTTPLPTVVPAVVPPELLGDWLQRTDSGTLPGAYQRRVYRFHPEGSYEYWNEWCPSYDECSGGYEWGHLQIAGNVLAFLPQTPSAEGQRSFSYSIEPDAIGAPTLRLLTPAGADVFYRP